jgi:hypothetical protein
MSTQDLLARISQQRVFSEIVMRVVLGGLMDVYYPGRQMDEVKSGDIGSYSRGTNVDPVLDLDIAYLEIPNDPERGFVDWSDKEINLMSAKQGRIDLGNIPVKDPRLEQGIGGVMKHLREHFGCSEEDMTIDIVRTWSNFPGVVVKLLLTTKDPGAFSIDVNLLHVPTYFGYEHGIRFFRYFERVKDEISPFAAANLIEDIRRLKTQAKAGAGLDRYGEVDRRRKVPGFVVEMLFTHQFPPLTYSDVIRLILEIDSVRKNKPKHKRFLFQTTQVVGEEMSFGDLMTHLMENGGITLGGWKLLREIAKTGGTLS